MSYRQIFVMRIERNAMMQDLNDEHDEFKLIQAPSREVTIIRLIFVVLCYEI
jgi:hypothetical protein